VFAMEFECPRLVVVAFAGGSRGSQLSAFSIAFTEVQLRMATQVVLTLKLITNKTVHETSMSEEELFAELLGGDIYIVLGHIHQGNPQWSAILIQELLLMLRGRVGWPERKHLSCPVLTQDKYKYIQSCHMITLPTLKIDFANADFIDEVTEFIKLHNEGCGWVLKLPFTTNGEGLKFCKSLEEIIRMARKNAKQFGHRMSYSMLQPCLENRREYKVCILDGKATFVADINQRSRTGEPFSSVPHTDLKIFAEQACEILENLCEGALALPLLRVDIMKTRNGIVVNEFESVEACFFSKRFDTFELQAQNFLREYWVSTISSLVTERLQQGTAPEFEEHQPQLKRRTIEESNSCDA